MTATIAKWLIPSVTALFAVVGYVVETAQQELLGLFSADNQPTAYFATAADFLRDVLAFTTDVLMGLLTGHAPPLAGHAPPLVIGTVLALVVSVLPRFRAIPHRWLARLALASLVLIIAGKFLILDEPLSKVEDIILVTAQTPLPPGDGVKFGKHLIDTVDTKTDSKDTAGPSARAVDARTSRVDALWADIVCSRVSKEAASLKTGSEIQARCLEDQEHYRERLRGEFVAQLWAAVLVSALAISLLRTGEPTHLFASIGILALAYCLTVPYAYGKLWKSTYFDYGVVRLARPLVEASGEGAPDHLYGLTLSHSPSGTNLLVAVSGVCSGDTASQYSAVAMSSLSAAQILSVEEIYRQDVVTWAKLNEQKCPAGVNPYLKAAAQTHKPQGQ